MKITCATVAAPGRANEDRIVCGDGWIVVLDGATAPEGVDSGCVHDVTWLVNHLSAAIATRMLLGAKSLRVLLAASIEEVCKAHGDDAGCFSCDLANPDSPSSTVSIVRVRDGELEYLVLGDSPVVIRDGDEVTEIADDRIAHLPGGRPYSLRLVRSLRNQPGGFWVASTDPQAAYEAVAGRMPWAAGTEVGVFTDGASRLVEFYGYTWSRVFGVLETGGPAELVSLVRSREQEQPPAHGKQHDDATAALMAGDLAAVPATGRPANWRTLIGM